MLKKDDLTAAVRHVDELAEQKGIGALDALDVDRHAVVYVAEQRALRVYAQQLGKLRDFLRGEPLPISKTLLSMLAALWMDGLASGLAAEQNRDSTPHATEEIEKEGGEIDDDEEGTGREGEGEAADRPDNPENAH